MSSGLDVLLLAVKSVSTLTTWSPRQLAREVLGLPGFGMDFFTVFLLFSPDNSSIHVLTFAKLSCGIHDETRSSKAQYAARVPCERHITVNFAMSMGDYYYEYTSAHIYTDGTRISRVEWHARLRP